MTKTPEEIAREIIPDNRRITVSMGGGKPREAEISKDFAAHLRELIAQAIAAIDHQRQPPPRDYMYRAGREDGYTAGWNNALGCSCDLVMSEYEGLPEEGRWLLRDRVRRIGLIKLSEPD